jgi:hypothetical protein
MAADLTNTKPLHTCRSKATGDFSNGPTIFRGPGVIPSLVSPLASSSLAVQANCSGPPTTVAIAPAAKQQDQYYDNNQYCHFTHSFQPGHHRPAKSSSSQFRMLLPRISSRNWSTTPRFAVPYSYHVTDQALWSLFNTRQN